MSESSRQRLCSLFRHGHTPSSALHCLKTNLLVAHGGEYYKFAGDGYYVPSLSVVSHLFSREFAADYGAMSGADNFAALEQLLVSHDSCKSKFVRVGDNYYVSLCTPIMKRAWIATRCFAVGNTKRNTNDATANHRGAFRSPIL